MNTIYSIDLEYCIQYYGKAIPTSISKFLIQLLISLFEQSFYLIN